MKIFGYHIAKELPVVEKIVEKVVYVERGDEVDVYRVTLPHLYSFLHIPDWWGRYYLTCHQALQECKDAYVTVHKAYVQDGKYFLKKDVEEVNVQPKPKVEKGAKK